MLLLPFRSIQCAICLCHYSDYSKTLSSRNDMCTPRQVRKLDARHREQAERLLALFQSAFH